MRKKLTVILPGDVVQKVDVDKVDNNAIFIGDNGAELLLPVEKCFLNDEEYLYARYSDTVPIDRVEEAIKTGK